MNKSVIVGVVLIIVGAALTLGAICVGFSAGDSLNTNDRAAVDSFLTLLTSWVGPLLFAGLAVLAVGLLVLAVKFFFWMGREAPMEQEN
jgi:hypothetical protein